MTVPARAILAYFQVAPSNHEDWEEVQPRSVTDRRLQRMLETNFAITSDRDRDTNTYSVRLKFTN